MVSVKKVCFYEMVHTSIFIPIKKGFFIHLHVEVLAFRRNRLLK